MHERRFRILFLPFFTHKQRDNITVVPFLAFISFGDKEGDEENDWRIFVVLCGVPCFLSCVASILYVPESPRWLLTQGKNEDAVFVLRRAARENGKDPDELFPMDTVLINHEEESENFMDLFKPQWRKTIILLWGKWHTVGTYFLGFCKCRCRRIF